MHEVAEGERARRPYLSPHVAVVETGPDTWVVTLELENIGSNPAERVLINVHVPPAVSIEKVRDAAGRSSYGPPDNLLHKQLTFANESEPREWNVYVDDLVDKVIDERVVLPSFWKITVPGPGRYPLMLSVRYPEIRPRAPNRACVWLDVPDRGARAAAAPAT